MIILYHSNHKITAVLGAENQKLPFDASDSIALGLHKLAKEFPQSKIIWCNEAYKHFIDLKDIAQYFHHNKMMMSFNPDGENYFGAKIGYIEESPFININKKVSYPTWQMSSAVGVVHASVLIALKDKMKLEPNFDYFLNSMAKVCMPLGLLCYSEPKLLLINTVSIVVPKASLFTLFKFVKQHYKTRWVFLLLGNLMIYERKFPVLPFIFSFFYRNRSNKNINVEVIKVQSSNKVVEKATIDVVIPTIGRKEYLYDVLCDLRNQAHLPVNVIIVEQNPFMDSVSELDYLSNESWPFVIKHTFTHQAGACNARNVALSQVESEWVFLNDDDNRFESNLLESVLKKIEQFGNQIVTTAYPQKNEKKTNKIIIQWATFGSGNSFVKSELLKKVKFNMALEFGYGEDGDFGKQLRNQGVDVLYLPEPQILHLKAPIGGFRTKPILAWHSDPIQPKPSPTVMLYQILHQTKEQILGYKTILFFKYYKLQKIKNPIKYYRNFQKQWKSSVFWANELIKKD